MNTHNPIALIVAPYSEPICHFATTHNLFFCHGQSAELLTSPGSGCVHPPSPSYAPRMPLQRIER